MVRNVRFERPEDVTRRAREYYGFTTDAERIMTHGINKPKPVVDEYARLATGAEKIGAAGLDQPTSIARLSNEDAGLQADGERIRTHGIN